MSALLGLIVIAALVVIVIGGIWMLIQAFSESILWGLGCLIVPFVSLAFLIVHWRKAKDPFFLQLMGLGAIILASFLGAHMPGFLR